MLRQFLLVSLALFLGPVAAGAQAIGLLNRDVKEIEALARSDTNDAELQYYLALAYWRRGRWAKADSQLRLTVRLEPRHAEGYLALYFLPFARRSQLFDELRRNRVPEAWRPVVAEAEGFYQRAFRTNPLVNLRVLGIAFDIKEPRIEDYTSPEAQAYEMYYAWFVDLGMGRYGSAYDRLRRLAQREFNESAHPERVPDYILWYRGLAAAHSGQVGYAIKDFRSLLNRALKPLERNELVQLPLRDNEYRFALATLYYAAGNKDTAVALYQEALEQDLGLVMAHTYLAGIHEDAGRMEAALLERRRAAEVSSDDPTALFEFGVSLFNVGQVAEAEEPLRRAVELNPRYSPPYYLLGRAAEELGRPADARELYTKFIALSPQRMRELRFDAEQRLGKPPE